MNLYKQFLLITLIANTTLYTVTIYFYYLIEKKYLLSTKELSYIMQMNVVGIIGNIFFSYAANKFRIHKIICASLIFMHALFFLLIILLENKIYAPYIMIGNALSAGGFNPVFDSLFLNYIRKENMLHEIGRQRQFLSLGSFFAGMVIYFLSVLLKNEDYVVFAVATVCGTLSALLIAKLNYSYTFLKEDRQEEISLVNLIEDHIRLEFFLLYLSVGLVGFFKLLFTNIQRNYYLSMGIRSEVTTFIKSLGNLLEFLSYFIFHEIYFFTEDMWFFLGIFFNVSRFILYIFFKLNIPALILLEIEEKVTYMIFAISLNRILTKMSSSYVLTFSQGLRYFFFFLIGSFLSGYVVQYFDLDINGSMENFQDFFYGLQYFYLLLMCTVVTFMVFYRKSDK